MFSLTPLFIDTAFPSSYSRPDEPPSPDNPSSFKRSSSSSSATVFLRVASDASTCFAGSPLLGVSYKMRNTLSREQMYTLAGFVSASLDLSWEVCVDEKRVRLIMGAASLAFLGRLCAVLSPVKRKAGFIVMAPMLYTVQCPWCFTWDLQRPMESPASDVNSAVSARFSS